MVDDRFEGALMGMSNKKKKTEEKSEQVQNITTQKTNPQFVTDALTGFTGKATGLMNRNPLDFVAGADPLQRQAAAGAGELGGWRTANNQGQTMAMRAGYGQTAPVSSSSLLSGLDDYISPYTDHVVDATLNDFDVEAGRTRAAQAASGARNGAFGGSRFGVREAQTEGELSRARATAEAGLRDQAFTTGAQLSNQDADRRQQVTLANQGVEAGDLSRTLAAGGLMGSLSEAAGANARGDIQTQLTAGDTLRGIDTEERQAPLGLMGAVGDLLGQGQFDLLGGSTVNGLTTTTGSGTTTEDPGLMAKVGQAVQTAAQAAALASDERLKTDIQTLGFDDSGRRWVSWRYLWDADDARHAGVIAQEILASDPAAVVPGPMGFHYVDYSKLERPAWVS